jgi:hypothetical protein
VGHAERLSTSPSDIAQTRHGLVEGPVWHGNTVIGVSNFCVNPSYLGRVDKIKNEGAQFFRTATMADLAWGGLDLLEMKKTSGRPAGRFGVFVSQ